ncbi:hypothetical protein EMCRGX_G006121 [Ephydatia muelleri]
MTPLSDWLNVLPKGSGIAGVTEQPLPPKDAVLPPLPPAAAELPPPPLCLLPTWPLPPPPAWLPWPESGCRVQMESTEGNGVRVRDKKKIQVSASTLVDLKAALFQKQQQVNN